jgi:hypothetical protein
MSSKTSLPKRLIFVLVMLGLMVGGLELLLNLTALASPKARHMLAPSWDAPPAQVSDVLLGHRPNPAAFGHDARGFRNVAALNEAPYLVLGGSQAYGTNVDAPDAWPVRLSQELAQPVYNMSFGGYGPTHFAALLPEALKLKPKVVIVDFCSANDLFDTYAFFYETQKKLEGVSVSIDPNFKATPLSEEIAGVSVRADDAAPAADSSSKLSPLAWIKSHSKIIGLARRIREEAGQLKNRNSPDLAWQEALKYADKRVPVYEKFEGHGLRTLFRPAYRLKGMNLDDPRVVEGQRLAQETLLHIHKTLAAQNIRFVVLLIPSKEYSFAPLLGAGNEAVVQLADKEEQVFQNLIAFMKTNHIDFINPLPLLREEVKAGHPIYFSNHDDHFNPLGHSVIAKYIAETLAALGGPSIP